MSHRVGDTLFNAKGRPGVIVGRTNDGARLDVEVRGENLDQTKKRGYINGLTQKERSQFNEIIDEVRKHEDPRQRITEYQEKIQELGKDPRNHVLVRYIGAELSHTMNQHRLHPKTYSIDDRYTR